MHFQKLRLKIKKDYYVSLLVPKLGKIAMIDISGCKYYDFLLITRFNQDISMYVRHQAHLKIC